jgi:hypothetical protein
MAFDPEELVSRTRELRLVDRGLLWAFVASS